jgi:hypothetical protein
MKRITILVIVGMILVSGFGVYAAPANAEPIRITTRHILVSEPIITKEDNGLLTFSFAESKSYLMEPGKPLLPTLTQIFTFPLGTKIQNIEINIETDKYTLSEKIVSCPQPVVLNSPVTRPKEESTLSDKTYGTNEFYPESFYRIDTGAGIQDQEHVLFVTVRIVPRYNPQQDIIEFPKTIDIEIQYLLSSEPLFNSDTYDLLIITPALFRPQIDPLVEYKNSIGIRTVVQTTEAIYDSYEGYDKAEQIKLCIKNAIETYGISYLLLFGDVNEVPMRKVFWELNDGTKIDMLVDLYYSDIYNDSGRYCSWDANQNRIFGENDDQVDFYPDVHLGRLPCSTINEVRTVVEKIITYENDSDKREWFNQMIVMAGDTFPEDRFSGAQGREGEEHTADIMNIMSMFNHTIIWTSKGNFNKETINAELSKGAGFVFYSGHGFPNGICPEGGSTDKTIHYYSHDINGVTNGFKLPIIFLTACSTAKLDFSISEILSYYLPGSLISMLQSLPLQNLERLVPCFAWNFVKHEGGGSIATIGSTDLILSDGYDYGGCCSPPYYFFESYNQSDSLGEMVTAMLNRNIQDIPSDSLASYTVMEHILLGDPSLKLERVALK